MFAGLGGDKLCHVCTGHSELRKKKTQECVLGEGVCVCVCVCVWCVCVCVCKYMHTCMHACIWGVEVGSLI